MENIIVYSLSFATASSKLSKQVKIKITETVNKFFMNPNALGLHREKVQSVDDDFYSLRVDDNYRIIYKQPAKNKSIFLLYVDTHEKAYDWAKRHSVSIDITGNITIFETPRPISEITKTGNIKPISLMANITDEQFNHVKVPVEYRELLRTKVFRKNQLIGFKAYLSEETYYFLEQVLAGHDIDEEIEVYDQITDDILIPAPNPIFNQYTDEDLANIGIPIEYLSIVKSIKTDSELAALQSKLPAVALQNLYALKSGEPIDSIIKITKTGSKPVDDNDFDSAIGHYGSLTNFAPLNTVEEIEQMMDMPMEKWRVFLHQTQRKMVNDDYNGPTRVLGGAGTGKTVITIHRAKKLAQEARTDEKILVTTFNKTLASDIETRLKMICSAEELRKIEVTNIDAIAKEILQSAKYTIAYSSVNPFTKVNPITEAWKDAIKKSKTELTYMPEFYEAEWQNVIQANNITEKDDYLSVQRIGRGKQLTTRSREEVWHVFEAYRETMTGKRRVDIDWGENICAELCNKNSSLRKYNSILVDECQDLRAPGYRMIRALAGPQHKNDLYFAGDSRQQIYAGGASLSKCGINVIGRSVQLKMNYRTTAEIYETAYKLQNNYEYDDLDGQKNDADKSICILHGETPQIRKFSSIDEEIEAVANDIKKKVKNGFDDTEICIVARRTKATIVAKKLLNNYGIPVLMLTNAQANNKSIPGVRIATMHRVKGMEFECMYLIQLNSDVMPLPTQIAAAEGDLRTISDIMKRESNLVAVSMTRAKKYACLSYVGTPTEILKPILNE